MPTSIVLLWGRLILWLTRPSTLILIAALMLISLISWLLFGKLIAVVAVKGFIIKTLPRWFAKGVSLLAQAAAKEHAKRIGVFVASYLAFSWVRDWFSETIEKLKRRGVRVGKWWKGLSVKKKTLYIAIVICLLWLPLGGWLLLFVPAQILKQFVFVTLRPVWGFLFTLVRNLGFSAFFIKLERKLWRIIPRRWRAFARLVRMRAKRHQKEQRRRLRHHPRFQTLEERYRRLRTAAHYKKHVRMGLWHPEHPTYRQCKK